MIIAECRAFQSVGGENFRARINKPFVLGVTIRLLVQKALFATVSEFLWAKMY